MTEREKSDAFLITRNIYATECSERITRNSVVMEFHPFQSKEPVSERIRFSFEKTTARNMTKEEASRVISRKIRVGMTFSLELARNCADEIAHLLLLTKANNQSETLLKWNKLKVFTIFTAPLSLFLLAYIYYLSYCKKYFYISPSTIIKGEAWNSINQYKLYMCSSAL